MHIRIREKISNGPMGRGLRDVTRRQYIKYYTGISALWITTFSTSCGRGKYWLIYQKPGGQEKGGQFTTVGLKCCTTIPGNANICAANTGCSFDCYTELPSELRSRKRRRLNFVPIAFGRRSSFFCSVGMKFSLLRFRDLCSEGSSV